MIWMLIGAGSVLAVLYWYGKWKRSRRGGLVKRLRRELRRLVHDPAVAERLVNAERARDPESSEITILRKVMRRLRRDRHR